MYILCIFCVFEHFLISMMRGILENLEDVVDAEFDHIYIVYDCI